MKRVAVAVFVVAALSILRAQAPPSPVASAGQAFDVAAIKQNKSGENGGRFGGPVSRFTATNAPALQFIMFAYRVRDFQVEGAPDWLKSDRWDINAKAEGNFPPPTIDGPDARRDMLRTLLVDRFKLSAHRATKEMPIYGLVTARTDKTLGPKLHQSTFDCVALGTAVRRGQAPAAPARTVDGISECNMRIGAGTIQFGTQSMPVLAEALSDTLQRFVTDRTRLTGNYSAW
jgi:uncharacterized protein (TIGR03435 family)